MLLGIEEMAITTIILDVVSVWLATPFARGDEGGGTDSRSDSRGERRGHELPVGSNKRTVGSLELGNHRRSNRQPSRQLADQFAHICLRRSPSIQRERRRVDEGERERQDGDSVVVVDVVVVDKVEGCGRKGQGMTKVGRERRYGHHVRRVSRVKRVGLLCAHQRRNKSRCRRARCRTRQRQPAERDMCVRDRRGEPGSYQDDDGPARERARGRA